MAAADESKVSAQTPKIPIRSPQDAQNADRHSTFRTLRTLGESSPLLLPPGESSPFLSPPTVSSEIDDAPFRPGPEDYFSLNPRKWRKEQRRQRRSGDKLTKDSFRRGLESRVPSYSDKEIGPVDVETVSHPAAAEGSQQQGYISPTERADETNGDIEPVKTPAASGQDASDSTVTPEEANARKARPLIPGESRRASLVCTKLSPQLSSVHAFSDLIATDKKLRKSSTGALHPSQLYALTHQAVPQRETQRLRGETPAMITLRKASVTYCGNSSSGSSSGNNGPPAARSALFTLADHVWQPMASWTSGPASGPRSGSRQHPSSNSNSNPSPNSTSGCNTRPAVIHFHPYPPHPQLHPHGYIQPYGQPRRCSPLHQQHPHPLLGQPSTVGVERRKSVAETALTVVDALADYIGVREQTAAGSGSGSGGYSGGGHGNGSRRRSSSIARIVTAHTAHEIIWRDDDSPSISSYAPSNADDTPSTASVQALLEN